MPARAFLLSHDEKALDAITQILGELEVSFETFHEPSFAAKRVASQHFDLVLVDCDHEQNAIEVFTALKKSGVNQTSIGIAVVDGKNGVANAFRLGATLVVAKPVAMEQARGTLRNALAMARKSSPEGKLAATVHSSSSSPVKADGQGSAMAPPSTPAAPKPAVVIPLEAAKFPPSPASSPGSSTARPSETTDKSKSAGVTPVPTGAPSPAKQASAKPFKNLSRIGSELLPDTGKQPATPTFGMPVQEKPQRKTSPLGLAFVAVALVAAGVYGYSMVNPGFHNLLLSQLRNLQSRTGLAPKPRPVAALPKPAPAPVAPAVPVAPPAAAVPATATSSAPSTSSTQIADGFADSQPADSQGSQSPAAQKPATPVILPASATAEKAASDNEPIVVPEDVAENHVVHRVQPTYPETARRKGVKGSVVLIAAVDADGNVAAAEVVSGNSHLAAAAVAAVKQWRYQTYYHNGQPTEFETQVTLRFPQPAHR